MTRSTDADLDLPEISDEAMLQGRASTRGYTVVILRHGAAYDPPRSDPVIWEHGRRNYALRAAGLLSIVCPIRDDTDVAGIGVFNADETRVEHILQGDPAIQADVLRYEIHPARSFPGDCLPAD
ncbi:MAG TPA: hypothetical protein VGJ60_15275 [Chloroflexota bacterium]|jgi:hypothetical protein